MSEIICKNYKKYWTLSDKDGKCLNDWTIVPAEDWCPKFESRQEA